MKFIILTMIGFGFTQKIKIEKAAIQSLQVIDNKCLVTAKKNYLVNESCIYIQNELEK